MKARAARVSEEAEGDVERAERARATVAAQLAELLVEQRSTGSGEAFAERVRQIGFARRTGDPMLLRAAIMEAALAGAQWVVAMDVDVRSAMVNR